MSNVSIKRENMAMAVSREDMVNYALTLGITSPKEMFNTQLKEVIKEALYHNCVVLAALIRKEKENKKPKEKALYVMASFLKENPRGLTRQHKQYISDLIFKLWVAPTKKIQK